MPIQVSVELLPSAADAWAREDWRSPELDEIREALKECGVRLVPQHPGVDDATLRTFFRFQADDAGRAEHARSRLLRCRGVTGAYVQPDAGLPG